VRVAPADVASMRRALAVAEQPMVDEVSGSRFDDVPVGAVVTDAAGVVVAEAANRRRRGTDPTAHAEVVALRQAGERLGTWRLDGCTLFVTLEPCPMCAGALVGARVARVVFGAANTDNGACGTLYNLCADPRLHHEVAVVHGVQADAATALLDDFFAARRP
jgi:tRNA(adenine34) deaminase